MLIVRSSLVMELPPRARRIRRRPKPGRGCGGTTSACAENTEGGPHPPWPLLNYLRVRGEYLVKNFKITYPKGTTSACAENTFVGWRLMFRCRNYLRVRGEYRTAQPFCAFWELPPRARRIHQRNADCPNPGGTTSACAENTRRHTS